MAKKSKAVAKPEIPDNACPRCWKKKQKIVVRETAERMAHHYAKKHPSQELPDRFYTGPRDSFGGHIKPYMGKFPVGTRVRLRGFYKKGHGAMLSDGTYKSGRHFLFYPELESYIREEDPKIIGKKGTVYDVSPQGHTGHPLSVPVIHVKLDKSVVLKYRDMIAISVLERELKLLDE